MNCLRGEHTVKRVLVIARKTAGAERMLGRDREEQIPCRRHAGHKVLQQ